MSSRITNSESQRGIKGETLHQADIRERHSRPRKDSHSSFRCANPSRWSDVEANNASNDCSTWPSWDASPGDNNVKRDEDSSDMRHKIPADPAFDGRRQQHHSRPLDDSWSQPQRVRGSVRSRDRDGSRSRSRSRGKGRSRSRSRSWDRGEGGGRGRSRSPFHEDRHESNANIDRVSGPRLSSRVCRDFAMGKCRRGSNCRFPHQENLNSQAGRHSDNDVTQRSSSRPEYDGTSRYGDNRDSADHMHDKVSDGSRRNSGKDEPDSRERSGSRPDGARGYPHHVASGDNHNRGNRNASYSHDGKGPLNRSGKVPCKFFPIGKCHREDCRFSHDAPMSESVDGRSRDDKLGHIADEKKKSWNGPTWDEVNASDSSDIAKSSRPHGTSVRNLNSYNSTAYDKQMDGKNMSWNIPAWDEVGAPNLTDMANSSDRGNSSARNLNSYDTVATSKRTDENKARNGTTWDETSAPGLTDTTKFERGERSFGNIKTHDSAATGKHSGARGGHDWEKNSRPTDDPVWNDKTVEKNEYISPGASTDAYMGVNEYMSTKKDSNEKAQLVFDRSRSQALDGISMPSHERNTMRDASGREPATTVMQAQISESSYSYGRDNPATFDDSNLLDVDMVSEDSTYPVLTPKQVFDQSGHSMGYQSPLNLRGNEKRYPIISSNPLNRPNVDLSGSVHGIYPALTQPIQTRINQNEAAEAQELPELGVRQVMPETSETVVSSEQVAQITDLPAILNQISQNGQLPQIIAALNPNNGMGLVHSIPTSASVVPPFPPVNPMFVPLCMDMKSKEQYDPARESMEIQNTGSNNEPSGILSTSVGKENEVPPEKLSVLSTSVPSSAKLHAGGVPGEEHQRSPKSKQQGPGVTEEVKNVAEKCKQEQEKNQAGSSDARGIVEEGSISNDEKAMRLFKIALVDFVKEILKPTWKEGGMSREVHKTIVKKVVDKVTSTVQGIQIPRTPEKIEQYLAFSKSKITKLVAAYVERLSKAAADA